MAVKNKPGEYPVSLLVKKGDEVEVISGKDRGKRGHIIRALPGINMVMIEGINLITKHQKAQATGRQGRTGVQEVQQGGRIKKPAPMFAAKVMLVCPQCHRPTRIGYAYHTGENKPARRKYRICKHPDCGKAID